MNTDSRPLEETIATREAMRAHYDGQVFAYSPTTGEECSANPADYFWLPDGVPLEDGEGEPMVLVRRVSELHDVTSGRRRDLCDGLDRCPNPQACAVCHEDSR